VTRPRLIEQVRRANAPPPPDHSVVFRVATTVAVLTGLFACKSVGELSATATISASGAILAGMAFSYATRTRPWQWLKILLAIAVIAVFASFVSQILTAAHTGQLASIVLPLAGLFTWVQVVHAFDVPARRDLLFSIAAGGALITIAGAQAVDQGFVAYAAVWLLATLVGLSYSWRSMAGLARPPRMITLASSLLTVLAVALALLVVLPQPRASQNLTLPASLAAHLPLSGTGIVNGTGANPTEPARAGEAGGRIGVGGFLGFAGPLATADRASLSNEVIMRVRADRPGYFLGMTYDTWDGQSWVQSKLERGTTLLTGGSPFQLQQLSSGEPVGQQITTNIQTFYVERPLANLLFATDAPTEVYFPARTLAVGNDGSLRTQVALTPGTVYTVVSADEQAPLSVLATDRRPLSGATLPEGVASALQLPHPYPRVAALARSIVAKAHAHTVAAVVAALESWMGSHTKYSLDIPPLRHGQDTVTQFLFGDRRGYCEQISTSLAVMLRSLGIPAREAIGYLPGPFDPLSDMYDIRASDAHAWVQVYFPHYGWQNFDPTAEVPLAPPNPGSVLLHDALGHLARLPWLPIGLVGGLGASGYGSAAYVRSRRRRPTTLAGLLALRLEQIGAQCGLPRRRSETLREFGDRLDLAFPGLGVPDAVAAIEQACYGSGARDAGDAGDAGDAAAGTPALSAASETIRLLAKQVSAARRARHAVGAALNRGGHTAA
jgi:transglutaminase-like putative cysteine protease